MVGLAVVIFPTTVRSPGRASLATVGDLYLRRRGLFFSAGGPADQIDEDTMWRQLESFANQAASGNLQQEHWIAIFVLVVIAGIVCLRGFGSQSY